MNMVEVPSREVTTFPSFKSIQYSPNKVEQGRLAQNKKNIMNSILCDTYTFLIKKTYHLLIENLCTII